VAANLKSTDCPHKKVANERKMITAETESTVKYIFKKVLKFLLSSKAYLLIFHVSSRNYKYNEFQMLKFRIQTMKTQWLYSELY